MDLGLRDRTYIVTGASAGLGFATAKALAAEGARLVISSRNEESITRAAAELVVPGTAIALSGGTTTYALAHQLLEVPDLTVVTNSVRVADVFHAAQRVSGQRQLPVRRPGVRGCGVAGGDARL